MEQSHAPHTQAADPLARVRRTMQACMQCGTCAGTCPNAFAMDLTPRQMWRLIQLGLEDEVLASRTFWLCSACYACTLRCPRGLPLTENVAALKRAAARKQTPGMRKKSAFYRTFMDNVRRYGRIQETALMQRYFLAMADPLLPLKFTPLAMKLMRRGKLHPLPDRSRAGKLEALFQKAMEVEARP